MTYQPIGHALDLFKTREKFVAIVGPARCGKSRAALEKALLFGMKYPGARILFTRKVRASMTESILETFESYVAPKGSPWVDNVTRASRTKYVMPNGTEIIIAGPGMVRLQATDGTANHIYELDAEEVQMKMRLHPVEIESAIAVDETLHRIRPTPDGKWSLRGLD